MEDSFGRKYCKINDFAVWYGAAEGIRTPDPRITNALLYRLSYRGLPLILQHIPPFAPLR